MVEWAPARLLCKRFGIKNPRPDPTGPSADEGNVNAPTAATRASASTSSSWDPTTAGILSTDPTGGAGTEGAGELSADVSPPSRSGPKDISNVGLGEDEDQGKDTLTYQRPAMDIFKAIFASDDEDSDEDDDEKPNEAATSNASGLPPPISPRSSNLSTLPPPSNTADIIPDDSAPIDPSSFRPTFVPKSQREGKRSKASGPTASGAKSKSSRKGEPKRALVSFGMEEDGDDGLSLSVVPEARKKKKDKPKDRHGESQKEKKRTRDVDTAELSSKRSRVSEPTYADDEGEWVEKPPCAHPERAPGVAGWRT